MDKKSIAKLVDVFGREYRGEIEDTLGSSNNFYNDYNTVEFQVDGKNYTYVEDEREAYVLACKYLDKLMQGIIRNKKNRAIWILERVRKEGWQNVLEVEKLIRMENDAIIFRSSLIN